MSRPDDDSPVNAQHGSSDEAGFIRYQEEIGIGNLARLAPGLDEKIMANQLKHELTRRQP